MAIHNGNEKDAVVVRPGIRSNSRRWDSAVLPNGHSLPGMKTDLVDEHPHGILSGGDPRATFCLPTSQPLRGWGMAATSISLAVVGRMIALGFVSSFPLAVYGLLVGAGAVIPFADTALHRLVLPGAGGGVVLR